MTNEEARQLIWERTQRFLVRFAFWALLFAMVFCVIKACGLSFLSNGTVHSNDLYKKQEGN